MGKLAEMPLNLALLCADLVMLAQDITLAGDASSSQTYKTITEGVRRDTTAGFDQPRTLTIKHEVRSVKGLVPKVQATLVRLERIVLDANGNGIPFSLGLTMSVPQKTVTIAQVQDMVTQLKNFLGSGNVAALLNSER